ncbi:hypothetical protein BGAL_0372g00160 [Botrytis galanthina]|uniref:Uncharacterized protein n=1 Tax=Botrytis galanthina TaxID=278940 RepID=A0A4S8QT63_9HELO|nr:hypothetical protein BGAL_0372g00160 [Botrytis galanthina]
MRFELIIRLALGALGVIVQVMALDPAGPWQIVAFFYAYRISINAFGVEKNAIASQSRGSIADGSCTLDEFVDFTRNSNKDSIPFPKWLIGNDLTPDPLLTVKMIQDSAYDAGQQFDASKLLPGSFKISPGHPPAFADQIQALRDQVSRARISMIGRIGLSQDFIDTEPSFANLKVAIHGCLDVRRSDFNENCFHQLMENLRLDGIAPVIRTVIAMGCENYSELDTVLTTKGSTSPAIDAEMVVNRVVAKMGLLSEDGKTRRHAAVIRKLEEWIDNLNASS